MRQGFHPAPFLYFNSQPHEEADGTGRLPVSIRHHFNSQPHEEADNLCPSKRNVPRHFNSQPHEEADDGRVAVCQPDRISTHSLTKRLTQKAGRYLPSQRHFNSQPHEEADGDVYFWENPRKHISTHSLTKRLTETVEV